jgi:CubicO group peptidase (beta-lactamase class C family)
MARRFLVFALLSLLVTRFAAQSAPGEKAEAKPAERLEAKVDAMFATMDSTISPGCALSVIRDHKIIYERGYGMADLDHNVPIMPTSVFHVASMSKQFTAASIMLLAHEGKLSLDDPVRKYIPELPDFGTPVTIRELLHHTSGLRDQWDLLGLSGWRYSEDRITDADVLYVVTHQKELNFKPNTKTLYSNTNYTLLAQIVARVSGQSLREFTTAHIFAPLGMKNTQFRDDFDEIVKNMAYGYSPAGDTFKLSVTNFDTVGATSLLTTVEDLALWDENFYNPRVGGTEMIHDLLEKGRLNSGKEFGYAAGLVIGEYRGLNTVDHGGADAGYRADLLRFPDQHFSVACLCNLGSADPTEFTHKVAEIYLGDMMKPDEAAAVNNAASFKLTAQQMQARAGFYVNVDDDSDVVRWILKDGHLEVGNAGDDDTYPVKAISEDQFHLTVGAEEFTFLPLKTGAPQQLVIKHGDGTTETFSAAAAFAPTDAQLAEYAGVYSSPEIDPLYEFKIEHLHLPGASTAEQDRVHLVLFRLKNSPDPLEPVTHDLFTAGVGKIRFTRDPHGVIDGFLLSTGRVNNLRFVRGRPAIPN